MILNHVGIVNANDEQADRFYGDFLGLDKTKVAVLSQELSKQLFNYSGDVKMMVFEKDGLKLEIFICPECKVQSGPNFTHVGLFLNDLPQIIKRASDAGVEHIIGKTADKTVHFIRDFYGNLIEIKQK